MMTTTASPSWVELNGVESNKSVLISPKAKQMAIAQIDRNHKNCVRVYLRVCVWQYNLWCFIYWWGYKHTHTHTHTLTLYTAVCHWLCSWIYDDGYRQNEWPSFSTLACVTETIIKFVALSIRPLVITNLAIRDNICRDMYLLILNLFSLLFVCLFLSSFAILFPIVWLFHIYILIQFFFCLYVSFFILVPIWTHAHIFY